MTFSVFRDMVEGTAQQRRVFFELIFGRHEGHICITYIQKGEQQSQARKVFFEYPAQLDEMLENIEAHSQQLVHAYFGVSLYENPAGRRDKANLKSSTCIWVDLDEVNPATLLLNPSLLVQTSPGKFQSLWVLQDELPWREAEEIARKIAYYHREDGADFCWDATHLFRIPYTPNYKYGDIKEAPLVTIIEANKKLFRPRDFDCYPTPRAIQQISNKKLPDKDELSQTTALDLLKSKTVGEELIRAFNEAPQGDWSTQLYQLARLCNENQFTIEQAFIICEASACNKFKRDNRPETDLWRDVQKAYIKHIEVMRLAPTATSTIPELLTAEEVEIVLSRETFVERYIKWAEGLTDASLQYHQSGAFIILSALLSGNLKLPTSFGSIIPNLWFMILGNTTLTRKTTAMNLPMKLLYEVDERALLATDGSLEGILMGMRDRPKQPSIFLRDEFSGLLEAIAHRDYLAGFAEQLTKLYDGEPIRRLLRKETIDIRDPIFIMYVGGPKTKTQMLITEELVMGGFLPRFILITAEPDLSRVRPIGPPVPEKNEFRETIKNELVDMHNHYVKPTEVWQGEKNLGIMARDFEAILTPKAWKRYNDYETLLTKTAMDAGLEHLTPVYDRLAKSTLKAAMLIAASTQRSDRVVVDLQDLCHAIYYAQGWRAYASEIVNGIGKSYDERLMERMSSYVQNAPIGVPRSELMNMFHLDAKRADLLLKTMEQRGMVFMEKERFYAE